MLFTLATGSACDGRPATPGPASSVRDADRLHELESLRAGESAPGALAMVVDGDHRWSAATGMATTDGRKASPKMRFRAASITKTFVAVLALEAVARHRLSLDDTVNAVLPGVLGTEQPVTIRQLLNHTSGIYNYLDIDFADEIKNLRDPTQLARFREILEREAKGESVAVPAELIIALAETHPRYFAPGAGYHYSNTNALVLGLLLEKITGRGLASQIRDVIGAPLRLEHTSLAPDDTSAPEMRTYYLSEGGDAPPSSADAFTDRLAIFGNGAAFGLLTNADDLATFYLALMRGRIVGTAELTRMKQGSNAPTDPNTLMNSSMYGLGLVRFNLSCGSFFGHPGWLGTSSLAIADETGRRAVVIAVNGFRHHSSPIPNLIATADRLVCRS